MDQTARSVILIFCWGLLIKRSISSFQLKKPQINTNNKGKTLPKQHTQRNRTSDNFLPVHKLSFSAGWVEFKGGHFKTVSTLFKTWSVLLLTSEAFLPSLIWISKVILKLFSNTKGKTLEKCITYLCNLSYSETILIFFVFISSTRNYITSYFPVFPFKIQQDICLDTSFSPASPFKPI